MKERFEIIWMQVQIAFYESLTLLANFFSITVLDNIAKFMYLYLMDDYKRLQYRNGVAAHIREMRYKNDPDLELAIERVTQLYRWMCDNQ